MKWSSGSLLNLVTSGVLAQALAAQWTPRLSSAAPAPGPPYAPSPLIESITWHWQTHATAAPGSDLWLVAWGPDNHLYAAWGDGGGFGGSDSDGRVAMGFARIEGSPEQRRRINVNGGKNPEHPASFQKQGVNAHDRFNLVKASLRLRPDRPEQAYFPPPESAGGWRKLDQPEDIRRLAGADPAKLEALQGLAAAKRRSRLCRRRHPPRLHRPGSRARQQRQDGLAPGRVGLQGRLRDRAGHRLGTEPPGADAAQDELRGSGL